MYSLKMLIFQKVSHSHTKLNTKKKILTFKCSSNTFYKHTTHTQRRCKEENPISISTKKWNERITVMSGQGKLDISNPHKRGTYKENEAEEEKMLIKTSHLVRLLLYFSSLFSFYSKHSSIVCAIRVKSVSIYVTLSSFIIIALIIYIFLYNNHHFFFLVFTGSNSIV